MPIWASHPKPKEGELLSSWLVRIASLCGMPVNEFCKSTLSIKKPNLRIIDRAPDDALVYALAEGTGVSVDRIKNSSLLSEDGYVFSSTGNGEFCWTIPPVTNNSHINKYTTGMAYCPACLHGDETAFYRRLWSYAFYSVCPLHRIPLRNACPHCKKPYSHLQPIAPRLVDACLPIGACWSCGEQVGNSTLPNTWGGDFLEQTLSVQDELVSGINQGAFFVPSYGYVHSRAYLDVMHCLANSLSMGRDATIRKQYVGKAMGLEFEQYRSKQKIFDKQDIEHLQAENRAILLCLTNWLMGDWPKRLLRYIDKFELDHNKLFGFIDKSYWLLTTAIPLLQSQPNEFKSEEEIQNATILLRSKLNRPVSTGEVKEFVTLGYVVDHTVKLAATKKAAKAWHHNFMSMWQADNEAKKKRRLAKIITWSQSKKFMAKINYQIAEKHVEHTPLVEETGCDND